MSAGERKQEKTTIKKRPEKRDVCFMQLYQFYGGFANFIS